MASSEVTRVWKIAPRAATPVAIPAWRNVLLIPDAIPARAGIDDADRDRGDTRVGHADADAGEEEACEQPGPAVPDVDPVHQHEPDPDEEQAGSHQRPEGDALREPSRDRRDDEREQRERKEAEPGFERRVEEHALDVEGQVQEHREHAGREAEGDDRDAGEGRLAEERQVEHRVLAVELDHDEGGEEDGGPSEAGRRSAGCPSPRRCRGSGRRSARRAPPRT